MSDRKAPLVEVLERRPEPVEGRRPEPVEGKVRAQQTLVTKEAPPMADVCILVVGWDPADNSWRVLNLGTLHEAQVLAERFQTLDRIDSRNGVAVPVPNGTALNAVVTGQIEVPAGEVWYLNRLAVTCPAADATGTCSFNILVSRFPKTAAGGDKPYLAADVTAMGATTNYDLGAVGQLGEELRLVGGDKLTLRLTATVAFTADKTFRLDVFGRRCKKLVA